jgi:hypothetical protein
MAVRPETVVVRRCYASERIGFIRLGEMKYDDSTIHDVNPQKTIFNLIVLKCHITVGLYLDS